MARQWRCAVIGTGTVGEWHVRTLPKVPGCELVAICDLLELNARKALDKNKLEGVPIYTDAAEMYRKEKIDAVHVCTPSGDHQGPATAAMERGKHVVVEKPMEIHPDRIDAMVATAKKHGVRLAGIFQNRWNPANQAIKKAMDEGRFGKLAWAGSFTPWYRPDKYYEDVAWRGTWKLDGGGAVMNQGVHQVDLFQWIVGSVKTVSAYASSRIHPKIEVEDTLTCAMQFASGAYGTFVSSTAMFPGNWTRLEIGGENGTAVSEGGLKRFQFRDARPEDEELLNKLDPARVKSSGGGASATDVPLDLHGLNIAAIYDAWAKDQEAETCGPEARKAVAIIGAMYQSVRKNGAPIDEPDWTSTPVNRGVLYIVWGTEIDPLLERSKESVRRIYPDMPMHVVRGEDASPRGFAQKAKMASLSPFESTLFLDADTVVLGNLDYAFDRSEEFGLACSICECPWLRRYGAAEGDGIEYNTGVVFFSAKSRPVFDCWESIAPTCPAQSRWLTMDGSLRGMEYEDQAGFARAVRIRGFNPFVLPLNYNFRPMFYKTVFAPLKIWHGRHDVPAALAQVSAACEKNERLVTYVRLGMAER